MILKVIQRVWEVQIEIFRWQVYTCTKLNMLFLMYIYMHHIGTCLPASSLSCITIAICITCHMFTVNGLYPFGLSVIALGVDRVYVLLLNHCAERAAAFSIRAGAVCVLSHEPRRNWVGGSWTSMSYEHRWPIAYCPFTINLLWFIRQSFCQRPEWPAWKVGMWLFSTAGTVHQTTCLAIRLEWYPGIV
jgi:hypothetical protein